jgi:hypothetical protein
MVSPGGDWATPASPQRSESEWAARTLQVIGCCYYVFNYVTNNAKKEKEHFF